jgi:hypothetical protein
MYPVYFFILGILIGLAQVLLMGKDFISAFLMSFLLTNVGLQGIFAFIGHFFRSEKAARGIGWPVGNPFQKEVAFANLSNGVLGLLSIWFHGDFWLAVIISRSVFTWGAGAVHLSDLRKKSNRAVFNAGPVLYFDFLFPLLIIGLFIFYRFAGSV